MDNFRNCLLETSEPKICNYLILEIMQEAGWTYIKGKNENYEFSINYSDFSTDASDLIRFFAEIINLKDDISIIFDYEGMNPLLYVKTINENNVRFIFAHDYNLYKQLCHNNIDDYNYSDYQIACDIVIDKTKLLQAFYNIFYNMTCNKDDYYNYLCDFEKQKAIKYLKEIEKFLQN